MGESVCLLRRKEQNRCRVKIWDMQVIITSRDAPSSSFQVRIQAITSSFVSFYTSTAPRFPIPSHSKTRTVATAVAHASNVPVLVARQQRRCSYTTAKRIVCNTDACAYLATTDVAIIIIIIIHRPLPYDGHHNDDNDPRDDLVATPDRSTITAPCAASPTPPAVCHLCRVGDRGMFGMAHRPSLQHDRGTVQPGIGEWSDLLPLNYDQEPGHMEPVRRLVGGGGPTGRLRILPSWPL